MIDKSIKMIVTAVVCGVVFAGCGGGSGSSGVKKNEYLGSLPGIYADYNVKKKSHEEKIEREGTKLMEGGEKNMNKIMKLMKEDEEKTKSMKEKLEADVKAELAKITGKEIPVSYSEDLLASEQLFYNVAPTKLINDNGNLAVVISLSAKHDFEVPRLKGYDYSTYFRFITSDGETITHSVLLPIKLENKAVSYSKGNLLLENNFQLYIANKPEQWENFAGIEFITKSEYDSY